MHLAFAVVIRQVKLKLRKYLTPAGMLHYRTKVMELGRQEASSEQLFRQFEELPPNNACDKQLLRTIWATLLARYFNLRARSFERHIRELLQEHKVGQAIRAALKSEMMKAAKAKKVAIPLERSVLGKLEHGQLHAHLVRIMEVNPDELSTCVKEELLLLVAAYGQKVAASSRAPVVLAAPQEAITANEASGFKVANAWLFKGSPQTQEDAPEIVPATAAHHQ